jgi:hypothetical protein
MPEEYRMHLGKGISFLLQIVNLDRIRRSLRGNHPPEHHVFGRCWYDYFPVGQVNLGFMASVFCE